MKPLTLTVEDVSCTEVWLRISASGRNGSVIVQRDSVVLDTLSLNTTDTTITDTGLMPSHTYTYKIILTGQVVTAQTTTMDTTSHNITWITYTLGDGSGSSTLYDVAIINDTLAYAVGEIHSGGTMYNVAKWNGSQWDPINISVTLTYTSSQIVTDQDPLKTIYAFNENDIWVVSQAGGVSHWNGLQWVMLSIPFNQGPGTCNKIWGSSSRDMYFVGNIGRVIHYDGTSWTKIESGTSLDIYDIYGATNSTQTGGYEILGVAGNVSTSYDRKILQIKGTTVMSVSDSPITESLSGIWFIPNQHYYVVGSGIYEKRRLSYEYWTIHLLDLTKYYMSTIRGNGINDVFACGAYGELMHFNGLSWRSYHSQTGIIGAYGALAVRGNVTIAVGEESPKAIILMGLR
jgi:hypothetical protein